jgi:hypothetical protein
LSTPSIEEINLSKFSNLSTNKSFVLNLAPGLEALIASAAATIQLIAYLGCTSK